MQTDPDPSRFPGGTLDLASARFAHEKGLGEELIYTRRLLALAVDRLGGELRIPVDEVDAAGGSLSLDSEGTVAGRVLVLRRKKG